MNQSASFSTSFSFQIEPKFISTNETARVSHYAPGEGMAFVMFDKPKWIGDSGGSLGIYSTSGPGTLAVEFDTFQNGFDFDNNHVGIDIESIESKIARNASDVNMALVFTPKVFAWIDYNASSSILEVRIHERNARPVAAFISYPLNLSDIFKQDLVWVGFSGANGMCNCHNYYTIHDWKLTSSPPTPSPSPSPPVEPKPSRSIVGTIGGVGGGIAVIFLLSVLLCCYCARRKKVAAPSGRGSLASHLDQGNFTYKQLCVATNNYHESSKLGQGGCGSVYRGEIPGTGQLVAVKRVNTESEGGEKQYVAEVTVISQIRHRNIVQLLGWCNEGLELLLVYELMPNGSLDKALFKPADNLSILPWNTRFNIVSGTTAALQYLHEGCRQQVIHRDVKSSNIMLDENFNAMLGDFGLARMMDHRKKPDTTLVVGTWGYIAPEVPVTGKFTERTDIFALGAVCLEVACGRKALDPVRPENEILLVDWVWSKLSADDLFSVVDSRLEGNFDVQQMELVLLLGLLCSHPDPSKRPSIHQVFEILKGRADMLTVPASKPAPVYLSDLPRYRSHLSSLYSASKSGSVLTTSSSSGASNSSGADSGLKATETSTLL